MPPLFFYTGGKMDKTTITISVPRHTTKEEIASIRNKYKDKCKVNIIVSGNSNPEDTIKNFLKARLAT